MPCPTAVLAVLVAALAGAAPGLQAQTPAPKVAPKPPLAVDIERMVEDMAELRWDMLAQAGDFAFDSDVEGPSFAFIQREYPESLPRLRASLDPPSVGVEVARAPASPGHRGGPSPAAGIG